MSEPEHDLELIAQTRQWVESVVIKHNFCPFAQREVEAGRVCYRVAQSRGHRDTLEELIALCETLLGSESGSDDYIETALFVLPSDFEDFYLYLDFLDAANRRLQSLGWEGELQLASFHPNYCFAGEPECDPANYTNRSPHPMLHVIREASLERALAAVDAPENIPERNIELARRLGTACLAAERQACLDLQKPD